MLKLNTVIGGSLDNFTKSRYIMKCGNCGKLLEYTDDKNAAINAGIQRKCSRCKAMNCTSKETMTFKGSLNYVRVSFLDRVSGQFFKGGVK